MVSYSGLRPTTWGCPNYSPESTSTCIVISSSSDTSSTTCSWAECDNCCNKSNCSVVYLGSDVSSAVSELPEEPAVIPKKQPVRPRPVFLSPPRYERRAVIVRPNSSRGFFHRQ